MTIAELVAKISLKGGKESVATMQGLLKSTIATKAALLGAATALYKMSDAARQSAMYMDMYQLNTGLSTQQLQQLSFRAAQAGVSMAELGSTIQNLQKKSAMAKLGYGWDPILTRFGLTPGQDPVTQLDKISAALKRLGASNPAEAHALASKVGLSDSMYYALMRTGTEQMNKQFVLTNKERQALVHLNQEWAKFWFYLKQVIVKIQALGATFQTGFIKILTRAVQGFYELFSRIYKAIEASDKLKYAVAALGIAFATYFAPELLLLGAIALVLEDIFGYFEGKDSVTGRLLNWIKNSEYFKNVWDGIKVTFELIKGVLSLIKAEFQYVYNHVKMVLDLIDEHPILKKIFEYTLEAAKKSANMVFNPLGSVLAGAGQNQDLLRPAYTGMQSLGNMMQEYNTNVYIQSTGNVAQDARNAGEATRGIEQTLAQQPSVSRGGKRGKPYRSN